MWSRIGRSPLTCRASYWPRAGSIASCSRPARATAGACASGMFLIVLMHHSEWFQGTLLHLAGKPTSQNPLPRRRFDPTCRLRGWQTLAAALDALRQELRAEGCDPFLAATCWNVPGELGFYCRE